MADAGVAGLVLGFQVPSLRAARAADAAPAQLSAYLTISPDNAVTIVTPGAELGQGTFTNLPKIICEELGADFAHVTIVQAPGNDQDYGNPGMGGAQMIGGSMSTLGYYKSLRNVGAVARQMLVNAAAAAWKVPAESCRVEQGFVLHDASGRKSTFGALAEAAARLPAPTDVKLKDPSAFTLIGKSTPRKDTPVKVDGSAAYGADIKLPGLQIATIVTAPVLGETVARYDGADAMKAGGVSKIVELTNAKGAVIGLAVVADGYWHARKAMDALQIEWTVNADNRVSTADITAELHAAIGRDDLARPSKTDEAFKGDVAAAMKTAAKTYDAVYEAPYLAHACMEPIAATAWLTDEKCQVWIPTQQPGGVRKYAAKVTGLPIDKVEVTPTFLGGGFGRKWEMDFPAQLMQIAVAMKGTPVCLMWTREQDMRHDFYRPAFVARLRGGLDAEGNLIAMHGRAAGQGILAAKGMAAPAPAADPTAIEGLICTRYEIENRLVEHVEVPERLPVGFWRSVGLSQNTFFCESAIDELAHLAGKDPFEFRRTLLRGKDRELKLVDAVAKMSGWGRKLPAGRGLGMSYSFGFQSYIAQVAEVSVTNGEIQVHKVWVAFDPGIVIDPSQIRAQVEGGVTFGLSAALYGRITVEKGAVVEGNFSDYQMLRMAAMPEVETELFEGGDRPTGAGEASVPGIAPAVANAIFAATGQRLRSLPLRIAGSDVA